MAVQRLMVINSPLAGDTTQQTTQMVQRGGEYLRSYGITPEAAFIGAAVGGILGKSALGGIAQGFLLAGLLSMALNHFTSQ